jgi:hypothetical protein
VNSILGFAVVVAVAGTICKVTITMGLVRTIVRRKAPRAPSPHQGATPLNGRGHR